MELVPSRVKGLNPLEKDIGVYDSLVKKSWRNGTSPQIPKWYILH